MNKTSMKIDSYFLALILEVFIVFSIFIPLRENNSVLLNFVMLCITFFSIMITYSGGTVIGLITTSVTIFIYSSYIFYMNLVKGLSIEFISYLWMVSIPIVTLTTGRLQSSIFSLQAKNRTLMEDYENLVTVDQETGLLNIKLFYRELEREISKSIRHKSKFTLMLIKLPYYKEIRNIIGEEGTRVIKSKVSELIATAIRNEDEMYKIENDTIAIIMPNTDIEGAKVVKNRIKDKVADLNLKIKEQKDGVTIDTKISIVQYDENIKSTLDFKIKAEEELQYDV